MDFVCKQGSIIKPRKTPIQWKNTLVGKPLVTDDSKVIKPSDVIEDVKRAWINTISQFTTMELDDGCFSFHFEDARDMQWVIDSRPWLVSQKQYLLLLTQWCPYTPPSAIKFSDTYPFWVQLHDIPYELMSRKLAKKMGQLICGHKKNVLEIDFDGAKPKRKKFMRIRVLVDVTKMLATGCWLSIPQSNQHACGNEVLWVAFKYEELPMVCYRCGIIGHTEGDCVDELPRLPIVGTINYNPNGVDHESVLPTVLVEGHVLRDESKRGYGTWIYEQTGWKDEHDHIVTSDDENDKRDDEGEDEDDENEDKDEAETEEVDMNADDDEEIEIIDELSVTKKAKISTRDIPPNIKSWKRLCMQFKYV